MVLTVRDENKLTSDPTTSAGAKVILEFNESQSYDASLATDFPANAILVKTDDIDPDSTRIRVQFNKAALPQTLAVNGVSLLSVDATGVVTLGPAAKSYSRRGKWAGDVVYGRRLVPGDTVAWSGATTYQQNIGQGNAAKTYVLAGGKFSICVPTGNVPPGFADFSGAELTLTFGRPPASPSLACMDVKVGPFTVHGNGVWECNDHVDGED